MRDVENLQEVVKFVQERGGYVDSHDNKFYPAEKFAGVCKLESGMVGFLLEAPIFCINNCYIDDHDTVHLSQMSISGTLVYKNLRKREDWEEFNDSLLCGKVKEVLLKDGTHICL